MAKQYDAALKHLIDAFADDWGVFLCAQLGLPAGCRAELIEADLSTVSAQADKLFRVTGPLEEYIHFGLESGWAGDIPGRMLVYNILAGHRYGGPVRSVAILLRPEANATGLTGELARADAQGREYLRFRYDVVRLWEMPAAPVLEGPLGVMPLGLLTNEAQPELTRHLQRVSERALAEAAPAKSADVWTSCLIVLGLRYDKQELSQLLKEVRGMKESAGYQMILE
jgi:hypothetical protein